MTVVRKKAMDAFLKGDKKTSRKSKSPADRSRLDSVDSGSRVSHGSRSSITNDDAATEASTVPTTVSQGTESVKRTTTISPNRSPAPSNYEQVTSAEGSAARTQRPRDFILPAAPIVLPCRRSVPLPYDTHVPPPFVSIGKALDPFRTMFQSSHPSVSVEELKFYCSRYFGTRSLGKYWIPVGQ